MDDEARVEEGLVRLQAAMLAKNISRYKSLPNNDELCIVHESNYDSVLD
jgi:hypothetical protein